MRYVLWVGFVYSLLLSFAPIPTDAIWRGMETTSGMRCGYFFPWIEWTTTTYSVQFLSDAPPRKSTGQLATNFNLLVLHPPGFDEEKFQKYMKGKKSGTYSYTVSRKLKGVNPIFFIFHLLWNGGLLVCLRRNYRFLSDKKSVELNRTAYFCKAPIANLLWALLVFHLCVGFVPVLAMTALSDEFPINRTSTGGFLPVFAIIFHRDYLSTASIVLNVMWNVLLLQALITNHRSFRKRMSEESVLT